MSRRSASWRLPWRRQADGGADEPGFEAAMARADAARDAGDWSAAALHYEAALAIRPAHIGARVQYGHALKENGRLQEAQAAYRVAAAGDPGDPDPWLHLGHVLKLQGRRDAALDAYAAAVERDPDFRPARHELIAAGARDRLPWPADDGAIAGLAAAAAALRRAAEDWEAVSTAPANRWNAFRKRFPIYPPPAGDLGAGTVAVVIDARKADAADLRWTLRSLQDQADSAWSALVVADNPLQAHPVASLAHADARIVFVSAPSEAGARLSVANEDTFVLLDAGARLDPQAIAWLRYARQRTGAETIYADHDHWSADWTGDTVEHPALQPFPDPDDLAGTPCPPAVVAVSCARLAHALEALEGASRGSERNRRLLSACLASGPVGHLPRVLGSVPVRAETPSALEPPPAAADGSILVVIPTHDQPDLLEGFVESLQAQAARSDTVTITLVDNRATPRAAEAIRRLAGRPGVAALRLDEPFNWSRLNNRAAAGRGEDILVFANDDMQMLTPAWDDRLRGLLARPEIGAVGARLTYPDGALQHGGLVLGQGRGRPFHEGVGQPLGAGGPLGRWRRTRRAAAVTGAFLACRRTVFEAIGGFDERTFAIAYNDIDFCLRVRAEGLDVLYAAEIELIHHESATRGLGDSPDKIKWDDSEAFDLRRRWGQALLTDPSVNPQWSSVEGHAFDGYRDPGLSVVLEHLDRSARAQPWRVHPADGGA